MRKVLECMNAYHAKRRPRIFAREEDVLYMGMNPCHGKIQIGPSTFLTGRLMMDVHNPCIFALRTMSNYWSIHDISSNPLKSIYLYENDAWVQVHHTDDGKRGDIGALVGCFT